MIKQPVEIHDHVLGPEDADAVLVEYGDYQSPDCAAAHAVVTKALRRHGDRLRFIYRHFPMSKVHPNAQHAAEAAEAAGEQGRFWQMHEVLFAHQDALDDGHLVEYAESLGLDTTRFLRAVAGHMHAERIADDVRSGAGSGVGATPAFFINGVRWDAEWQHGDVLLLAIEQAASAHVRG